MEMVMSLGLKLLLLTITVWSAAMADELRQSKAIYLNFILSLVKNVLMIIHDKDEGIQ